MRWVTWAVHTDCAWMLLVGVEGAGLKGHSPILLHNKFNMQEESAGSTDNHHK